MSSIDVQQIKALAKKLAAFSTRPQALTHCQALDFIAEGLGHFSFRHLKAKEGEAPCPALGGVILQSCKYVELNALVPPGWNSFWARISENAPFSWGDNNRSLVTASDFLRHVGNTLEVCEPDYASGETDIIEGVLDEPINYQDYKKLVAALEALGETYVDLEN